MQASLLLNKEAFSIENQGNGWMCVGGGAPEDQLIISLSDYETYK